jgi:hypothetical protein
VADGFIHAAEEELSRPLRYLRDGVRACASDPKVVTNHEERASSPAGNRERDRHTRGHERAAAMKQEGDIRVAASSWGLMNDRSVGRSVGRPRAR